MGTGSKGGWSARSSTMRVSPTTQNQINNNIVQVVDGQAHAHTHQNTCSVSAQPQDAVRRTYRALGRWAG